MEQHPLGSQAFIPLDHAPVSDRGRAGRATAPRAADLRAFVTDGRQGVNCTLKGVWHHPVIAWRRPTDFLVVDRGGPGENLVEIRLTGDRPRLVEASV